MLAIIPIGGFRQRTRNQMGLAEFWVEDLRPLSGPSVFIHPPVEWSHDAQDILGTLKRVGATELIVVAYSWGVGHGARRLVKRALKEGLTVKLVATCDGVWKSALPRWVAWLLSPISIARFPLIKFPAEIETIVGVFQTNDRPSGHRIFRGLDAVSLTKIPDAKHTTIDEHHQWRAVAMQAIASVLFKP